MHVDRARAVSLLAYFGDSRLLAVWPCLRERKQDAYRET
jgi:hypothetical protein